MKPDSHKIIGNCFRLIRETMGLAQPAYARLFGVERAIVQELELGELPSVLDERLLRFILLAITLENNPTFIAALLREMRERYGLTKLFAQKFPFITLYQHILGEKLEHYPWITESVHFSCRAVQNRRGGSFLLLWAEPQTVHSAMVAALPTQTCGLVTFINQRILLLLPTIYLFLDINTSNSTNPAMKTLELKLEKQQPIGLALPYQLPTHQTIKTLEELTRENMRLFAYSQDMGLVKEVAANKQS